MNAILKKALKTVFGRKTRRASRASRRRGGNHLPPMPADWEPSDDGSHDSDDSRRAYMHRLSKWNRIHLDKIREEKRRADLVEAAKKIAKSTKKMTKHKGGIRNLGGHEWY
jgi:hypothetical protein